ncbi:hypothetical protein GCM10019059_31110 [Camelimonas fluminis]|nr:hypothetical protein GCM10019059_31110 [Camelimonas fluminis]
MRRNGGDTICRNAWMAALKICTGPVCRRLLIKEVALVTRIWKRVSPQQVQDGRNRLFNCSIVGENPFAQNAPSL